MITVTKLGKRCNFESDLCWCFIADLLMQYNFRCVNLIGRSRRTWKTNRIKSTNLKYICFRCFRWRASASHSDCGCSERQRHSSSDREDFEFTYLGGVYPWSGRWMTWRSLPHCTSGRVTLVSSYGRHTRHNLWQRGLAFARPSPDWYRNRRRTLEGSRNWTNINILLLTLWCDVWFWHFVAHLLAVVVI
jgi:hypothetical protein